MSNMPGFGDSATWPPIGAHGDPRLSGPEPADEVEQAQDLIAEIREQMDRAEASVCRRDEDAFRIAMLNAHDLSGSLFQ